MTKTAKKTAPKRKPKSGCGGNCTCHLKAKASDLTATPPDIADVLSIVGKLQGMSDQANARASFHQMADFHRDRMDENGDKADPMDIFRVAQARRLAYGDPDFIVFHTLAWFVLDMPTTAEDKRLDKQLAEIGDKMDAIRQREGLPEDEYWTLDEAPDDFRALSDEWDARADELRVQLFRLYGEHDMASLYQSDREEFHRRFNIGRRNALKDQPDADLTLLSEVEAKAAAAREGRRVRRITRERGTKS